tara:strand:- start:548 stop:793 length:246 start_codon:yes stop_codon:yes gene_type:complete
MTKEYALAATSRKFSNLMDGDVLPNVGVVQIINYYESLIIDKILSTVNKGNIESNFQEDQIEEYLNEADFWDGDESNNFQQ